MPSIVVTPQPLSPQLLETLRTQLEPGDPYLQTIDDHRAEGRAHHHPTTLVATIDDNTAGYALLKERDDKGVVSVDIVVPVNDNEFDVTRALLESAVIQSSKPMIWWARAPRIQHVEALADEFAAVCDRIILRMQRTLEGELNETIPTRGYQPNDIDEIVRINNEAFASHPDRANLTAECIERDLHLLGNRYEDLRITDGGFSWLKRVSATETECFVLAIDNAHQGHGLGGKLLETSLYFARNQHGASIASLYVEYDNIPAISLYKKLGFEETGQALHSVRFN